MEEEKLRFAVVIKENKERIERLQKDINKMKETQKV